MMEELKQKIELYVESQKRNLPSSRGSLKGLTEKLQKFESLLPEMQTQMNLILNEHLGENKLSDDERTKVTEIFKNALKGFMSS